MLFCVSMSNVRLARHENTIKWQLSAFFSLFALYICRLPLTLSSIFSLFERFLFLNQIFVLFCFFFLLLLEFRMWIVLLAIDRTIDRTSSIWISQNKNLNFDSVRKTDNWGIELKVVVVVVYCYAKCRNKIKAFQTSQSMAFAIRKKYLQLFFFSVKKRRARERKREKENNRNRAYTFCWMTMNSLLSRFDLVNEWWRLGLLWCASDRIFDCSIVNQMRWNRLKTGYQWINEWRRTFFNLGKFSQPCTVHANLNPESSSNHWMLLIWGKN